MGLGHREVTPTFHRCVSLFIILYDEKKQRTPLGTVYRERDGEGGSRRGTGREGVGRAGGTGRERGTGREGEGERQGGRGGRGGRQGGRGGETGRERGTGSEGVREGGRECYKQHVVLPGKLVPLLLQPHPETHMSVWLDHMTIT